MGVRRTRSNSTVNWLRLKTKNDPRNDTKQHERISYFDLVSRPFVDRIQPFGQNCAAWSSVDLLLMHEPSTITFPLI
jgi:predicted oxidoreductase